MTLSSTKDHYKKVISLHKALQNIKDLSEKVDFLNSITHISDLNLIDFLKKNSLEDQYLIKCLIALGQDSVVLSHWNKGIEEFDQLISTLKEVEQFYDVLGGVIGYHLTILRLICEEETSFSHEENTTYRKPSGMDISQTTPAVKKVIRAGIENLGNVAEIYPVGGAGDRLNLCNGEELLPAAQLPFMGITLLETMIRDLQGREYLHFKLFGKQVQVPIAMMTSVEKRNHEHILSILEKCDWFHRKKENYFLFTQPMVPVIAVTGEWMMSTPGQLMLKPGGHGVLWKLALEKGLFDWLYTLGYERALVRQINNPIAGLDYGLLAFIGIGLQQNKAFGFSSCNRYLNVAEGMDILVEKKTPTGFEYSITNIEYTEFAKKGVKDVPENPESPFSIFPANTNILFVNLKKVQEILSKDPIPGMLINMKTSVSYTDKDGLVKEIRVGRLESTMQNIADHIVDQFSQKIDSEDFEKLQSYIVFNEREKTICVTKRSYNPGESLEETPEGCFYHIQKTFHDLLTFHCKMQLPEWVDKTTYLRKGPAIIVFLHPALGPVWSIIAQKIQSGIIEEGSELQLSIAELEIKGLHLKGSLLIEADDPFGNEGGYEYSENCGRCILTRVTVKNKGINRQVVNQYWKNEVERHESLKIKLHGNSEFVADNISLIGDLFFEVPAGYRMTVTQSPQGKLNRNLDKITQPTWFWNYSFDEDDGIQLVKTTM